MVRHALPVVLVVVLALGAGCSGFLGPRPASEAVTPAPVPETETPLAPGIPAGADTGSIDTFRLGVAHERALDGVSYRLRRTVTVEGRNGSLRIERDRRVRSDGAAAESLTTEAAGEFRPAVESSDFWTDGSRYWTRTSLSNGRTIVNREYPEPPQFHRLEVDLPRYLLDRAEYRVYQAGSEAIVLRSTTPVSIDRSLVPVAVVDARDARVQLTVSRDGSVRRLHLIYTATAGDDPVSVTIRQRVTGVGSTPVSRPDWIDAGEGETVTGSP